MSDIYRTWEPDITMLKTGFRSKEHPYPGIAGLSHFPHIFKARVKGSGEWVRGAYTQCVRPNATFGNFIITLKSDLSEEGRDSFIKGEDLFDLTLTEVDGLTVCQQIGMSLWSRVITDYERVCGTTELFTDDLLGIYKLKKKGKKGYERERVALIHILFDDDIFFPVANFLEGSLDELSKMFNIDFPALQGPLPYLPFTLFLHAIKEAGDIFDSLLNDSCEWEILGSIHDDIFSHMKETAFPPQVPPNEAYRMEMEKCGVVSLSDDWEDEEDEL